MRPFVFRAETVRTLRRRQDEQAQQALAFAEQRVRQAEQAVTEAEHRFQEACTRSAEADREAHTLDVGVWYRNWIQKLRHDVEHRRRLLAERRVEAADAKAFAHEAHKRWRVLDKLRERLWAAHRAQEQAEEQRALDELASQQYANRRVGGHLEY